MIWVNLSKFLLQLYVNRVACCLHFFLLQRIKDNKGYKILTIDQYLSSNSDWILWQQKLYNEHHWLGAYLLSFTVLSNKFHFYFASSKITYPTSGYLVSNRHIQSFRTFYSSRSSLWDQYLFKNYLSCDILARFMLASYPENTEYAPFLQ